MWQSCRITYKLLHSNSLHFTVSRIKTEDSESSLSKMDLDHNVIGKNTTRKRQAQQNRPPRLPIRTKKEPGSSSALSDKENSVNHLHQLYGVKQEPSSRRPRSNRAMNRKTPRRYQRQTYHGYSSPLEELGNVVYVPRAYKSADHSLLKREYQNRQQVLKVKEAPQALLNIGIDQTNSRSSFLNKPNPTSGVKVEYIGYNDQVTEPDITKHEPSSSKKCSDSQQATRLSENLACQPSCQLGSPVIISPKVLDDVIDMELEYELCQQSEDTGLPDDLTEIDVGELYCSCKSSINISPYLE